MKAALYIGSGQRGSTAQMRYISLCNILNSTHEIALIDTAQAFKRHGRLVNSIGVRFKLGPLVSTINKQILASLQDHYDFIWVDKGNLITPSTIAQLRSRSALLLHYTPDPAFFYNKSDFFRKSIQSFDYCITTKSFEIQQYKSHHAKSLLYCTQGYDANVHFPRHTMSEKMGVAFIGRHEYCRERTITSLLKANIPIKLGGPRWSSFARRHRHNKNLTYYGVVTGDKYSEIISSSQIALGLLSKLIPEKHTTRTFEIPASGSLLATERNEETKTFFNDDEALFFSSEKDLIQKIKMLFERAEMLRKMTERGYRKVTTQGHDYNSILKALLEKTGII